MLRYSLTDHSRERMVERGVSFEDITAVLQSPSSTHRAGDKTVWIGRLHGFAFEVITAPLKKGRLLIVSVVIKDNLKDKIDENSI